MVWPGFGTPVYIVKAEGVIWPKRRRGKFLVGVNGGNAGGQLYRLIVPQLALGSLFSIAGCGGREVRGESPPEPGVVAKTADDSAGGMSPEEVVRGFTAVLRSGDRAAVLRAVDVPFFEHRWFAVIEDRSELDRRFDEVLAVWGRELSARQSRTTRFGVTRPQLRPAVRRVLDRVLGEDDYVVRLGDAPDGERYVLVRARDGKVVGITTR
jgi:hypothetical protein